MPDTAGSGGVDVGAYALAEAEFTVTPDPGGDEADVKESQLRPQRIELRIVAKCVADVGDVA